MTEKVEVIVIGGGQAGLAISYYLTQQGREHIVLEQGHIGETWRKQRWDSFTLVTPNWMLQLPGFPYQSEEPDGFLPRSNVVEYLENYVDFFRPPLRRGLKVTSVQQKPICKGYIVKTAEITFEAIHIVIATGGFSCPKIPSGSANLPANIFQIHSSQYRNPQSLPPGSILVVGSGQSGCQIAEELHQGGRKVYLATSDCGRIPRCYRGKDTMWWQNLIGIYDRTVDMLPSLSAKFSCNPYVSGKDGGHDINLRQLASEGMILLGNLQVIQDNQIHFKSNLVENLNKADAYATAIIQQIDKFIYKTGIDVVEDSKDFKNISSTRYEIKSTLNIESTGLSTIIWATGFIPDFKWIQIPVFDEKGYPIHKRGITIFPGLYFLGLPWLHKKKSALFLGVGEDASYIMSEITTKTSKG